jgi:photosystem II stability/assembly factor-like uncharacterized protein
VLRSDSGGRTWSAVLLLDANDERSLYNVAVADSRTIVVVGSNLLMRSTDAGASWTEYDFGPFHPRFLTAVAFANPTNGIVVGSSLGENGTDPTSPRPLIMTTNDGGSTWTRPGFPKEDWSIALRDVCLTGQGIALTGGWAYSGDAVLVSRTFGTEWDLVPTDPMRLLNPLGVDCLDTGDLWVAFAGTSLLHSRDGGDTWAEVTIPNYIATISDLEFLDGANGLAVSRDAIASTTDGGASWTREVHPYDGSDATFGEIVVGGSAALVGGSYPSEVGRVGVVLVRTDGVPGWFAAELPVATEVISGLALTP